ncbi:MAG: hypothetical protein ACJ72O_00280, partial [Marmoricola sp.]
PNTWRLLLLPPEGSPAAFRSAILNHRELVIAAMDPYIGWLLDQLDLADVDRELAARNLFAVVENLAQLMLSDPARFPMERLAKHVGAVITSLIAVASKP